MSPRRRLLLVAVALVLVLLVAAGAVLAARGGSAPPAAVAQDRPGPVLLVPGYGGGRGGLEALAGRLRAAGREATVLRLPGNGTGDLTAQAAVLGTAARAAVAGGAPSVDVVGYSAGGVVARLWVRDRGGAALTRRVVTLGSPQHGTDLATLAGFLSPGSCPAACRQLEPDSALLAALNRGDETPPGPRWVSIWTAQDQVVDPPGSARLAGAVNVVVQDVCPGRRVAHGDLPGDAVVQGLVLRALAVAAPSAPSPADCRSLAARG